ncbi:hypothetical protein UA08_08344 [Talaromyces atroroseus]|uniref:Uncharacterized protein n=1 Tax=Talaromyces atroroseus TaxID=1441469 RepID=A0A225AEU7_TALAT|nr:hypothetical protein UA08_08344 [Talaromyces atroroseus]OKL56554.1 hypothetical protein UA08_08344 [Talaromyces atroroseus]
MCFFGAYRYALCGHTDFQIVVFCKNFLNPATLTGSSSIVPGATCMPRLRDPQRNDAGNIVQYNVVLPDHARAATASYLPSQQHPPQGLQQAEDKDKNGLAGAQISIPACNPSQISGLCANCTATAQTLTEIHQTQPDFGLSSEYILDASRMNAYFQYVNNGNNNLDNSRAEQLSTLPSQAGYVNANVDPMLMGTTNMSTNTTMNGMDADMPVPVDPRILNSNADANLTNMHGPSIMGMADQNGDQNGAMIVQQQPQTLYHNTQANYTHNGYPISSSSNNGHYYNTTNNSINGNGDGDNTMYQQNRSRGRIVRNLGMPEDPFLTTNTNGQQVAIPRLFQKTASPNKERSRDKNVRFAEPNDNDRSNLPAYTPSKYRPSRLEMQALKLRKGVRRSAVAATTAATAARNNRPLAPAEPVQPTTEAQATTVETRPRQRASTVQRLSERWQSALRSRSKASTSDSAVKNEEPADKAEGGED